MHASLRFLPLELQQAIVQNGQYLEFRANQEIIREGQYIGAVPLVLEGVIKVVSQFDEKEILLYYIQAQESCIMSLTAILDNIPSRIIATTETETKAILIPAVVVNVWLNKFPAFQQLFFKQYHLRYGDLLSSIQQLLFQKIDSRVLTFLKEKSRLLQTDKLKISHREIANNLGTAREVVSRAIKKLEHEGYLHQMGQGWIAINQ